MSVEIAGGALVVPGMRGGVAQLRATSPGLGELPVCWESCGGYHWPVAHVSQEQLQDLSPLSRLRRAGKISLLAAAAAREAIADAGLTPEEASRMPGVFVTSDGGVVYTAKFFSEVSQLGSNAGSPLLFPETVYNAPASHVAALLSSQAEMTTFVGDASAAAAALAHASLLLSETCPYVLMIAANECAPIACAGYSKWGFLTTPFSAGGHVLTDGAAALILRYSSPQNQKALLSAAICGRAFRSKQALKAQLRALLSKLDCPQTARFLPACWRTIFEEAELEAAAHFFDPLLVCDYKNQFGESLAASPIIATVAWLAGVLSLEPTSSLVVSCVGFSGSVALLHLTKPEN